MHNWVSEGKNWSVELGFRFTGLQSQVCIDIVSGIHVGECGSLDLTHKSNDSRIVSLSRKFRRLWFEERPPIDPWVCKPNFLNFVMSAEDDRFRRKWSTLVENFPADSWENKVETNVFCVREETTRKILEALESTE